MKTILNIPWPSQVFHIDSCTVLMYWYNSTVSLTMILLYISGFSVPTVFSQCQDLHSCFYLCLCTCLHFSCTALLWDASLRIMENDEIWGAIVTILCHDSSTVDSRQWSRYDRNRKCNFVEDKDSMLGGPHVFHMTNAISGMFVFYYDGRNKNDRQIWVSELFLLIEFPYKGGP